MSSKDVWLGHRKKRFKTLRGVLETPSEELQQIDSIGPHSVFGVNLVQEVAREFLKEKIVDRPVYKSAREVRIYIDSGH